MELITDELKFKRDATKDEWFCHNIAVNCTKEGSVIVLPNKSSGRNINVKPTIADYCVYSVEFTVHDEIIFHIRIPDYSLFMNDNIRQRAVKLKDLYKEHVMRGKMKAKDFNNKILENVEW